MANGLTEIQQEIQKAIEQLSQKGTFTEYILAKKIRENNKIDSKKKAGILLNDILVVLKVLEEKNIFYSVHINSVNDILLKKEDEVVELSIDSKRRRQTSEKSMSVLTSVDLKNSGNKKSFSKNKSLEKKNKKFSFDDDYE